jgi:hypothetical protein
MLSVAVKPIMLSVIMLSVVMLNVVVPISTPSECKEGAPWARLKINKNRKLTNNLFINQIYLSSDHVTFC